MKCKNCGHGIIEISGKGWRHQQYEKENTRTYIPLSTPCLKKPIEGYDNSTAILPGYCGCTSPEPETTKTEG